MNPKAEFMQQWLREEARKAKSNEGQVESMGGAQASRKFSGVPLLGAFLDMDYYYIVNPLTWTPSPDAQTEGFRTVTVPKGFVTDFASVPSLFWSWLPPQGRYGIAAMVHDYLYWEQSGSRAEADGVFERIMQDLEVASWRRFVIFRSVSWFGDTYWRENTALKASGRKRVLREFPDDPKISWDSWSQRPEVFA